ncbi:MAG: DNA polymerase III subunit gamma/tau, partial [Acidobacteria bacterium]|nr:DNA polymerase III subunit gamma/tau [Acidobacteriota bacterium]
MYQVLARKWRPANFDELVGQKHVSRTLTNAIESNRLAHAYVFAGLRGTGKTSVARILAKCLNCETGPTASPCSRCDACTEIAASRAMDVMEIDAASRTKVEQTRELLELVSYAPVRDRYKILIIDEAHMLSKQSFNALLKTLEEPPPNVIFVLATTELGKLLPTILSRCQVFEFRRIGTRDLAEHLRRVCDAEKIEISDSGLERIARAGEGSVRDSLSILERVRADLNGAWLQSKERQAWERQPNKWKMFHESYYGNGVSDGAIARARDQVVRCLTNLRTSESYRQALSAPFVEIRRTEEFLPPLDIDITPIYAVPDLQYRLGDGTWTITDWKTGLRDQVDWDQMGV